MTALNAFSIVVASGSILLFVWKALDWIEDRNAAARARLASDVRARQRMNAVIAMSDWSPR